MSDSLTHGGEQPASTEVVPVTHQTESVAAREDSVLALSEPESAAPPDHEPKPNAEQSPQPFTPPTELPTLAAAHAKSTGLHDRSSQDGQEGTPAEDTIFEDLPAHVENLDEPTTIVLAEPDEDAVTTLLPASAHNEDEPTTIVHAAAGRDDEVTTLLLSPPIHESDEATTLVLADTGKVEDEATTFLTTADYNADEPTTLVSAGPDGPDDEPTSLVPAPEPLHEPGPVAATHPHPLPPGERSYDESVTEIRPAALQGNAARGAPDWFFANLQYFTQTLRQDESGTARPPQEVQQLALAARDMIARVAMQGGSRPAAEGWTGDTVLQPDQLLANTYIVRSLIARGGIGEIYRTRHRDLRTEHAVKVLLPRYALDPTVLTLMQDEARLLACVRHEAVVRCQDLLRDADGRPMLVMDFLRGRTLSARLREGRLPTPDLIVLARRLAEGLTAIHAAGIVHQDISPDNVILADDSCGAATIIDFGLARRVGTGRDMHRNLDFAGKYSWSSPEQLSGRPTAVDARSDLYSLGLMLAAAARGYRLDMGQDLESARAARTTVPSLAGIEQPLAGLIEALLAPSPEDRLGSATDIEPMLEPRSRSLWARVAPYFGLRASF